MRNTFHWLSFFVLMSLTLISCAQAPAQQADATPPAGNTGVSKAELEQMLAPIALYPDTVLTHVLIAATYPLEVVQADRWMKANPTLQNEDAVNAAQEEGWDPSVSALAAFPQLLDRMSEDLSWTQDLGDAFLADEDAVMQAIQTLRGRAYASGNLQDNDQVKVVREEKVIYIEPAVERVVYLPWYDTRVVYGPWWWPRYPPVVWYYPPQPRYVSRVYWGPRVVIGPTFYFSAINWNRGSVVVINNHRYPPAYSSRSVAHYHGATRWHHNPVHRRNVHYRSPAVREKYRNVPPAYYRTSTPTRGSGSRVTHSDRGQYATDRKTASRPQEQYARERAHEQARNNPDRNHPTRDKNKAELERYIRNNPQHNPQRRPDAGQTEQRIRQDSKNRHAGQTPNYQPPAADRRAEHQARSDRPAVNQRQASNSRESSTKYERPSTTERQNPQQSTRQNSNWYSSRSSSDSRTDSSNRPQPQRYERPEQNRSGFSSGNRQESSQPRPTRQTSQEARERGYR